MEGITFGRRDADERAGTVAGYYEAWQTRRGDMSDVPLAEDFRFTGRWRALRPPIDGHQLAGIVAVRDSMAVEILRRFKARPDAVRSVLADRMGVDPQRLDAMRRRRRRLLAASH